MICNLPIGYKMQILETQIRNKSTSSEELRDALIKLGQIIGEEILGQCRMTNKSIITPMSSTFYGKEIQDEQDISIIISTADDYEFFAKGIAQGCKSEYRGYIDFDGMRGENVYSSPYRSLKFPEIKSNLPIKRIIIAKSVIASGCTVHTLAKAVLTEYFPEELIIAAPFYSKQGVNELQYELKNAKIYVAFGPDEIDNDGMLVPGVGNIDKRLVG